ncbi:hypothetical protein [Nocardioides maradonensis]
MLVLTGLVQMSMALLWPGIGCLWISMILSSLEERRAKRMIAEAEAECRKLIASLWGDRR